MEDAAETIELRYSARGRGVTSGLLAAGLALLLVLHGLEYPREGDWFDLSLGVLLFGWFTAHTMHGYLLARRGWVRVTGNGVTVRDWLGREYWLAWDTVEQLCVYPGLGPPPLKLHAEGRAFGFDPLTIDTRALGNAIVRGAGLTKQRENWWVAVYRRPAC